MQADWGNSYLRKLYDELITKKAEDLTDEERHFCFDMYLQEEYWTELE